MDCLSPFSTLIHGTLTRWGPPRLLLQFKNELLSMALVLFVYSVRFQSTFSLQQQQQFQLHSLSSSSNDELCWQKKVACGFSYIPLYLGKVWNNEPKLRQFCGSHGFSRAFGSANLFIIFALEGGRPLCDVRTAFGRTVSVAFPENHNLGNAFQVELLSSVFCKRVLFLWDVNTEQRPQANRDEKKWQSFGGGFLYKSNKTTSWIKSAPGWH